MGIGEGLLAGLLGGASGGGQEIMRRNQATDKEEEVGRLAQMQADLQEQREKAMLEAREVSRRSGAKWDATEGNVLKTNAEIERKQAMAPIDQKIKEDNLQSDLGIDTAKRANELGFRAENSGILNSLDRGKAQATHIESAASIASAENSRANAESSRFELEQKKKVSSLMDAYEQEQDPAKRAALAEKINVITGRHAKGDDYIAVPVKNEYGEITGHRPFNKRTGLFSDEAEARPTQEAPQKAIDYLKKHPEAAGQFKQKYGYLPKDN